MVNGLNDTYRFAKFTVNPDDGGINAEIDLPCVTKEFVEEMIGDLCVKFAKIVDDAYPVIMKAIWA